VAVCFLESKLVVAERRSDSKASMQYVLNEHKPMADVCGGSRHTARSVLALSYYSIGLCSGEWVMSVKLFGMLMNTGLDQIASPQSKDL
jgi:hypothetical protein